MGLLGDSAAWRAASGTAHLRYCLLLVLLPLLAVPALVGLGASDFFLRHGASVWVRANDAVFDMRGRECDVLVFGDSTAMTGIDPELVTHQTGFRTCNIAVTNAVLAVTGELTLDRFLARNSKPRILLIQLAPDSFEPASRAWEQTIYTEGMLELLRHGDPAQAHGVFLSHPRESVAFAGYAAGFSAWYALKDLWFHVTRHRLEEDSILVHNGFFTTPSPARTSCGAPDALLSPGDQGSNQFSRQLVANLHSSYAGRAGVVLVNVAPIPACDSNLAVYQTQLHGLTSNSLQPLPISLFNDSRHYTARGSEVVSKAIARELNAVRESRRFSVEPALVGLRLPDRPAGGNP